MNKIYPVYTTIEKHPNTICQNLDEKVFEYPFFNDGVKSTKVKSRKKHTLISAEAEAGEEILELKGIIFNISHCGSTLLCRMLNQLRSVKVISESEAINGLLLSKKLYSLADDEVKNQFKRIIRLYQQKTESKRYLIIKLSSWNIFFINLILQVFPKTKWIYLDRDTELLINSLMKSDGGFIDWWQHPVDELRKYFIESGKEIKTKEEYLREVIRGHRKHAFSKKNQESLFLKYPNFIEHYQEILKHFRLESTEDELITLKEIISYDSKSMSKKLWNRN